MEEIKTTIYCDICNKVIDESVDHESGDICSLGPTKGISLNFKIIPKRKRWIFGDGLTSSWVNLDICMNCLENIKEMSLLKSKEGDD